MCCYYREFEVEETCLTKFLPAVDRSWLLTQPCTFARAAPSTLASPRPPSMECLGDKKWTEVTLLLNVVDDDEHQACQVRLHGSASDKP
jgi:hypothetical protein